jgi:GNAT superfamily N-acetyltransferase
MPLVEAEVSCSVADSFRVRQVAGMFDLPIGPRSLQRFAVEVPGLDEPWQIGLIVGPSGSGKSTIARRAFGEALREAWPWPADRAVIDCFHAVDIRSVTRMLAAVGFSSPPAWLRPYAVLSNGEKFRCDLARRLLEAPEGGLVVMDEFSSMVDRTVAKIGSAAVAKAIRQIAEVESPSRVARWRPGLVESPSRVARWRPGFVESPSSATSATSATPPTSATGNPKPGALRFVAVSCHYDIAEWLGPDWVVDMATGTLARGRLQRPPIALEIRRCQRHLWALFKRHHYLNSHLPGGARCYVAAISGQPRAVRPALSSRPLASPAGDQAPSSRLLASPAGDQALSSRPLRRLRRPAAETENSPRQRADRSGSRDGDLCRVAFSRRPLATRLCRVAFFGDFGDCGDLKPGTCVAFAATCPVAGFNGYRRFSRVVVLPDYQGIGVGGKFRDAVAELEAPRCRRLSLVTSHPAMIRSLQRSGRWRLAAVSFCRGDAGGLRRTGPRRGGPRAALGAGRRICSFYFLGR